MKERKTERKKKKIPIFAGVCLKSRSSNLHMRSK